MTAEEIKCIKGKHLYSAIGDCIIYVLEVTIDGVWVDAYGNIMYCNGATDTDEHFDLGMLDIEWMDKTYGTDKWCGEDGPERRYKMNDDFSVISTTKARKIFNERIREIKDCFGL